MYIPALMHLVSHFLLLCHLTNITALTVKCPKWPVGSNISPLSEGYFLAGMQWLYCVLKSLNSLTKLLLMAMHWCHRSHTNPCWLHLSSYLSNKYNWFGNYGLFSEMLDIPVFLRTRRSLIEAVTQIYWKSTFFMSVSWINCLDTLSILFAVTVDFSLAILIYTGGELRFKKRGDLEC